MALRTVPGLHWAQDGEVVVILPDPRLDRAVLLTGLEAALWGWLALGYDRRGASALAAAYLDWPEVSAAAALDAIVLTWEQRGIMQRGGE